MNDLVGRTTEPVGSPEFPDETAGDRHIHGEEDLVAMWDRSHFL